MKPTYKFPFFGAGEATYFEWAFVEVVFKEEPTEEQKNQIEKNVPFPIAEIEWDKNGMSVGSEQFAHVDIAETYQTKDGLDPNDKENWEDGCWFIAANSQVSAFNTDIERWLNEIHEISPILLALRNEDDEAGGTELSDWHTWSLKQFKSILPYFDAVVANFDYDSRKAEVLLDIFYFPEIEDVLKLDNKYLKYFYPGEIEFDAFIKGNIEPLKSITNSNYLERTIRTFNNRLNEDHLKELEKYVDVLLGFESKISETTFKNLNKVLFTHFTDINSETFKTIANKITSQNFIDNFAGKGYRIMADGKHKESIQIFEKILLTSVEPNTSTGFYTNILWVFQKDNTGFPVNKRLNKLALEKSTPKGVEYPAIFFNACCIYTEMGEYDNAYKMVLEALVHHYDKKYMINEIKTLDMFKEFRTKTDVLNLLKNYILEPKENPKPRFIGQNVSYHRFDTHTIYGRGYRLDHFSHFVLINGNVNIKGEFKDTYTTLIEGEHIDEKYILIIVNGNLTAKSITKDKDVYILVMGTVNCKKISHEGVIEKGNTNFDYIENKPKKHNE